LKEKRKKLCKTPRRVGPFLSGGIKMLFFSLTLKAQGVEALLQKAPRGKKKKRRAKHKNRSGAIVSRRFSETSDRRRE